MSDSVIDGDLIYEFIHEANGVKFYFNLNGGFMRCKKENDETVYKFKTAKEFDDFLISSGFDLKQNQSVNSFLYEKTQEVFNKKYKAWDVIGFMTSSMCHIEDREWAKTFRFNLDTFMKFAAKIEKTKH